MIQASALYVREVLHRKDLTWRQQLNPEDLRQHDAAANDLKRTAAGELAPTPLSFWWRFLQHKTAFILTGATLAATFTGFLREMSIAKAFGVSARSDAFTIMLFLYETVYTVVLNGAAFALVPFIVSRLSSGQPGVARAATRVCSVGISLATLCLALPLLVMPAAVVHKLFPEVPSITGSTLIKLMGVAGVGLVFMGAGGVYAAALNARQRFLAPVLGRGAFNLAIVIAIVFATREHPATGVGVGLVVAGTVQFGIYALRLSWPSVGDAKASALSPSEIKALATSLAYGLATFVATNSLVGTVERVFLSTLAEGAFAAVNFAQRSSQLVATLAIAFQTVAFEKMARDSHRQPDDRSRSALSDSMADGLFYLFPLIVFCYGWATPLMRVIYERGAFTASDVARTAAVFRWYTLATIPGFAYGLLVRALFSERKTAAALVSGLAMLGADVITNFILVPRMGEGAIPIGLGVGMLAGAIACLCAWPKGDARSWLARLTKRSAIPAAVAICLGLIVCAGFGRSTTAGADPGAAGSLSSLLDLGKGAIVVGAIYFALTASFARLMRRLTAPGRGGWSGA